MEQHAVPQHIASFEFKLFGNLTLRQFIFLSIPLSVAALIFFSTLPVYFRFTVSAVIAGIGSFVALVPYNGRPVDKWIVIFIKAVTSPTQRIWIKEPQIPEFLKIILQEPERRREPKEPEMTRQDREKLIDYLRLLPKGQVSPLDVREQQSLVRLGLTSEGAGKGKLPSAIFWGTTQGEKIEAARFKKKVEAPQTQPTTRFKPSKGTVSAEELRQTMGQSLPGLKPVTAGIGVRISPHLKPYALPGLERRLHAKAKLEANEEIKVPRVQIASEANFSIENVIPITTPSRQIRLVHGVNKTRARKLHFAPPPGFDLSDLPVRGEARFEISEELKRRYDREEKEKMLQLNEQTEPGWEVKREDGSGFGGFFKSAFSQAKSVLSDAGGNARRARAAVPKTSKSLQKPTVIAKHTGVLFPKASLKQEQRGQMDSEVSLNTQKVVGIPTEAATLNKAQIIPLTDKPNVISGVVVDIDETPIDGVIVIIRDANGIPVRALKTSRLGQFLSATPLTPGNYSFEVEGGVGQFDPVSIILTDKIIEPLMIKARK